MAGRFRLRLNFPRDYGIRSGHRPGDARPTQDEGEDVVRLPFGRNADTLGSDRHITRMKIADDYKAKYRLWAVHPRVVATRYHPSSRNLPVASFLLMRR
jgi:hypothetical protein